MSRLSMLLALFWGTFVHEDAALFSAAWMVTHRGLPWPPALLAVFAGIVASDPRFMRWVRRPDACPP